MIGDVGEMFGLYWDFMEHPYCTYQIFSKEGVMMKPMPITIPKVVMIHDFAITENYAIFLDLSLLINPKVCIYKPTRTSLDILVKTSKMPN
jgi:carotenoid cleavage dioxygenase